jgi:peptidoglycan/LPS O-acetylase OafA/YrhL
MHVVAPSPAQVKSGHRGNNFDVIRFTLAFLVIFSHSPEFIAGNRGHEVLTQLFHTISFGEFAVDGFFLLSGYLIIKSWQQDPTVLDFLAKRILRIYPGFIVACAISVWIFAPLAAPPGYFSQVPIGRFFGNLLLLNMPETPDILAGANYPKINAALWTIRFEFMCYLSVLAFGCVGLVKRRQGWLLATVMIFLAEVLHHAGVKLPFLSYPDILNLQFLRLGMFFFSGGCFYLYADRLRYSATTLVLAGLALVGAMFFEQSAEIVLALAGAYLLFFFAMAHIGWLSWYKRLPDVSYGVYLYGWPIGQLLLWFQKDMSAPLLILETTLICIVLASLSWYLVEKPFMRLKPKRAGLRGSAPALPVQFGSGLKK